MRSVFLLLLLLNILYALWQLQDGITDRVLQEQADQPLEKALVPEYRSDRAAGIVSSAEQLGSDAVGTVLCVNLGNFATAERAEQMHQRLLALGVDSEVVSFDGAAAPNFRLVMRIAGGRPAALARLAELQQREVESFLITEGEHAGSLALGVFEREDYARARMAQLRDEGLDVGLQQIVTARRVYRVQVDSEARRLVSQSLLGRLRESFPELQHQYLPCRAVAGRAGIT